MLSVAGHQDVYRLATKTQGHKIVIFTVKSVVFPLGSPESSCASFAMDCSV